MTVMEVEIDSDTESSLEDDRLAHVVVPKSEVTKAYITGSPVTSLCGKTWVPTRTPERYPICKVCADILSSLQSRAN